MALIVETGAQVANADSYISVVDAQTYLSALGKTVTVTEALLLQAMNALMGLSWQGYIVSSTQALSWPRVNMLDCELRVIESDTVPVVIGYAQALICWNINAGYDPNAIASKKVISETVDVISISYSDKGGSTEGYSIATMPEVKAMLKCYTSSSGYLGRA